MNKDISVQNLMGVGHSTDEIAHQLSMTKSAVIKAMHRIAKPLYVSYFCECKRKSRKTNGILMNSGMWYCVYCYKQWGHINHKLVAHYTKAGIRGKTDAEIQEEYSVGLTEEQQEFHNMSLGEPFVEELPKYECNAHHCSTTSIMSPGLLRSSGAWYCIVCAKAFMISYGRRTPKNLDHSNFEPKNCIICNQDRKQFVGGQITKAGNWTCDNCIAKTLVPALKGQGKGQGWPTSKFEVRPIEDSIAGIHPPHSREMTRRVRMTPQEFADLKDKVLHDATNHPHNPCGEITLEGPHDIIKMPNTIMTAKEIKESAKKLSGIIDFTESPKGWDIISRHGKQAFLRHDGVIVHLNANRYSNGWFIQTTSNLLVVNRGFSTYLEAIAAADEHIPMGELL